MSFKDIYEFIIDKKKANLKFKLRTNQISEKMSSNNNNNTFTQSPSMLWSYYFQRAQQVNRGSLYSNNGRPDRDLRLDSKAQFLACAMG